MACKEMGLWTQLRKHARALDSSASRCVCSISTARFADTSKAIIRMARETLEARGYDVDALGDLHALIGPPLFDGFADFCHVPPRDRG